MTAATFRAKGVRSRCAPGRLRVAATIGDETFVRLKALAVANKRSISAQVEALINEAVADGARIPAEQKKAERGS